MKVPSRLLMNHSLLPSLALPRKTAGEKIRKEAVFSQGVEASGEFEGGVMTFSTLCYEYSLTFHYAFLSTC
jgi:hypothetical protein